MTATQSTPVCRTYTEKMLPTASCKRRGFHWTPITPREGEFIRGTLMIETGRFEREYRVFEFAPGSDWDGRTFHVERTDGEGDYAVFIAREGTDHRCDCKGAESLAAHRQLQRAVRRNEASRAFATAGCKHIDALLDMRANGWLDPSAKSPEVVDQPGFPEAEYGDAVALASVKDCPFCGSKATLAELTPGYWWWVHCEGFGCGVSVEGRSPEEAREKWNRRQN